MMNPVTHKIPQSISASLNVFTLLRFDTFCNFLKSCTKKIFDDSDGFAKVAVIKDV